MLIAGLINLLGIVSATVLACNDRAVVAQWLAPWWQFDPQWVESLCFFALLLAGVLLVHWIMRKLATILQWERLHWLIQGAGLLIGAVRGLWWAGLFVLLLQSWGLPYFEDSVQKRWIFGPQVSQLAQERIAWVADWFPGRQMRGAHLVPQVTVILPRLPSLNETGTPPPPKKRR